MLGAVVGVAVTLHVWQYSYMGVKTAAHATSQHSVNLRGLAQKGYSKQTNANAAAFQKTEI